MMQIIIAMMPTFCMRFTVMPKDMLVVAMTEAFAVTTTAKRLSAAQFWRTSP